MLKKIVLLMVVTGIIPLPAIGFDFSSLVKQVAEKQLDCILPIFVDERAYLYTPDEDGYTIYEDRFMDTFPPMVEVFIFRGEDIPPYILKITPKEITPVLEKLVNEKCSDEAIEYAHQQ